MKYLSLTLDSKLTFKEHAEQTAKQTAVIKRQLRYILPNMGGAGQRKRKLLLCVVTSKLLYGAPCWAERMTIASWKKLETVSSNEDGHCGCVFTDAFKDPG
ncbi:Uncharacterized protein FWK35_00006815 [Aphis craccivora]|uniref:Reverse transcriptase domain-containing protein n=1 Tax=Aphis craccivora TaxID=307492 RepID=A0A6G0ZJW2_APHCR|nr:Uncharacterized protein FWK35_00006815 [Aphis craccivora]